MQKFKIILFMIVAFFLSAGSALAAPYYVYQVGTLPQTTSKFYLGTTTPSTDAWKGVITDQLCLTADSCRTTWPSGSGGAFPFAPQSWGVSTSTTVGFTNGIISNASSTFTVAPTFSSLTGLLRGNGTGALTVAVNGTDYTLITAKSCSAGDFVSSVTAAGVFTCTTPSGSGITAIGPTGQTQSGATITLASSTSGTDFSITGAANTLTFNLPTASASNRGLLSSTDFSTFNGKESALTFSTGLTRSVNTITVNTSQNITTLSNLTSNGAVLTSGGAGTLGIYTGTSCTNQFVRSLSGSIAATCATVANTDLANSTISGVALGGTLGALSHDTTLTGTSYTGTSAVSNWGIDLTHANTWTGLQQFNGFASSTGISANFAAFGATGTTTITSAGLVGVASSTPWGLLSVNPNALTGPAFAVGSSTATSFLITNGGNTGIGTSSPFSRFTLDRQLGIATSSITVAEYAPATSTAQTVDCRDSNTVHVSLGTPAMTITLASMVGGQTCKVIVSNPNATAGAITWATTGSQQLSWAGGTAPTQTTTANKRDVYSFIGDQMPSTSTTTPGTNILGAATLNF